MKILRPETKEKKKKWNQIRINSVLFKSGYLIKVSLPPQFIGFSSFKKKYGLTKYSEDYTNKAYQWLYFEWWFIICTLELSAFNVTCKNKTKTKTKKKEMNEKNIRRREKKFSRSSVVFTFRTFRLARYFVNVRLVKPSVTFCLSLGQ